MAMLVTTRYANALFALAEEKNSVTEYETEASEIIKILRTDSQFIDLLTHPSIVMEKKIELVSDVFEGRVTDDFVGLMILCIKKYRQNIIVDILEEFVDMAKAYNGFIKASVTSAVELNENQLTQIKSNLEESTNKQIELHAIVDEDILGGLIIRVGDKVVDGSVRGKMRSLQNNLLNLRLA